MAAAQVPPWAQYVPQAARHGTLLLPLPINPCLSCREFVESFSLEFYPLGGDPQARLHFWWTPQTIISESMLRRAAHLETAR